MPLPKFQIKSLQKWKFIVVQHSSIFYPECFCFTTIVAFLWLLQLSWTGDKFAGFLRDLGRDRIVVAGTFFVSFVCWNTSVRWDSFCIDTLDVESFAMGTLTPLDVGKCLPRKSPSGSSSLAFLLKLIFWGSMFHACIKKHNAIWPINTAVHWWSQTARKSIWSNFQEGMSRWRLSAVSWTY